MATQIGPSGFWGWGRVGGRRAQGGRVNPGGMGSECDRGALYGIPE